MIIGGVPSVWVGPEDRIRQQLQLILSKGPIVLFSPVSGWGLSTDAVETRSISFIIPAIDESESEGSIHLSSIEEGALVAIVFVGMMVGSLVWGSLADLAGRRICLIISLSFNGVSGLASSLSPNFPLLLTFRFLSGVG